MSTILQNALSYLNTLYVATGGAPYDFQAVHTSVIDFQLEHGLSQWPQAGTGWRYWIGITTVEPENPFAFVSNDGETWTPAPGGTVDLGSGLATPHQLDDTGWDWNDYDGYGDDFDFSEDIELVYDPVADCIHAFWVHTMLRPYKPPGRGVMHRSINNDMTVSAETAVGIPWVNEELPLNSPTVVREAADKWHMWGIYQDTSSDKASNPLLRKLTYCFGTSPTSWGAYQVCDLAVDPMTAYPNDTPNHIAAKLNPAIPGQVDLVIATLRWPLLSDFLSQGALVHAVTTLAAPTTITTPLAPTRLLEYAPSSWEKIGLYRSSFTLQLVGTDMTMRLWYTGIEDYMHPRVGLTSGAIYEVADGQMVLPPDATAPTVTFSIPATSTGLTVAVTLTATDDTGVTGYKLTEASTPPLAGDAGWSATAPTEYTFAEAGSKTLYAWAKDAAGNVSAGVSDTVVITLDTAVNASLGTLSLAASATLAMGTLSGVEYASLGTLALTAPATLGLGALSGVVSAANQIRAPNGDVRILRNVDGTIRTFNLLV